jgi:DNA-binding GntR family transcriptional regulator
MSEEDEDPRAYVRIAANLRQRIMSGELAAGKPLPSITTLTQEWGVARETASHAVTVLVGEGLVRRVPGLGYHVTSKAARGAGPPDVGGAR